MPHGDEDDPRYPSPRALRDALGQTIDIVVTVAVGVAAALAAISSHVVPDRLRLLDYLIGAAVALVASFVVRVPVQAALGASPGRRLFGLRAIRPSDGGRVTLLDCARVWGANWLAIISLDQLCSVDVGFAQVRAVDLDR